MSTADRALTASRSFDPLPTARSAQRQIGLRRTAAWTIRGAALGGIAAALVLVGDHLWAFSTAVPIAGGVLLVGLLAGMAIGIRRWPDALEAARAVDLCFSLHDRLTTALELRGSDRPLAAIQRADTEHRLTGLALRESARGQMDRREAGVAAVIVALVLALAAIGLPATHRVHAQASANQQRRFRHVATTQLPAISRTANQGLTSAARRDAAIRRLNLALQHLRFQLQHAANRAAALRAVSATQQELRRIAASLHPIKPSAIAQLNRALAAHMTAQQRAQAAGTSLQATNAAAGVLNRLAHQIAHMTPAQRAALAQSLAREASSASDSTLRSALQQAASSLGYNDPQSAARALQQAALALRRSPNAREAQSRLNTAAAGLESTKGDISGLSSAGSAGGSNGTTPGRSPRGTGASRSGGKGTGAGQGNGKGTPPGSGKGNGTGSGNGSGQGNGSGRGNGHGRSSGGGVGQGQGQGNGQGYGTSRGQGLGAGQGQGNGGIGGVGTHGTGGGRGGAGNRGAGRYGARVYVPPVKMGKGAHTLQGGGPKGAPLPGATVPYQQVLGSYQQTARSALDRGSLPSGLQTYVRQYFSAISH